LPTTPPERSTIELWALVWLDRVVSARAADEATGPLPQWADIAACHPAVAVLLSDDQEWGAEAAQNLGRLGSLLADVHSWPVLRAACSAGEWPVDDIPPDVAAWLDDGSFSRWVLGGYAPVGELAATVRQALAPSTAKRVAAALQAWELA
jgi:hypothetical protein